MARFRVRYEVRYNKVIVVEADDEDAAVREADRKALEPGGVYSIRSVKALEEVERETPP